MKKTLALLKLIGGLQLRNLDCKFELATVLYCPESFEKSNGKGLF